MQEKFTVAPYSLGCREEVFSETGLQISAIPGNPEGIRRAGAVRPRPLLYSCVRADAFLAVLGVGGRGARPCPYSAAHTAATAPP